MIEKTKYGRPRCQGRKLSGLQCKDPIETPYKYCFYCGKLVRGECCPAHPGYDPRKGKINGWDWIDGRQGGRFIR